MVSRDAVLAQGKLVFLRDPLPSDADHYLRWQSSGEWRWFDAPWEERLTSMTPEFGKFFLPGPTEVHPDVLSAMERPMIPHRGQEMVDLMQGMEEPLRRLARTERRVLIGTCSATGFMEMARLSKLIDSRGRP